MVNKRPPFLGYNHNVRHKGRLFHVQTEDSGLSRLVLTTHVFVEGTILATLRAQYTADEPDPVVQKRMQAQHKAMLKRVRDSEFDQAPEVLAQLEKQAAARAGERDASSKAPSSAVPESSLPESSQETQRLVMPPSGAANSSAAAAPVGSPARKPGPPPPPQPARKDHAAASGVVSGTINVASPPVNISGESTAELLPVPKTQDSHALAARLGISPAMPQGVVPPPLRAGGEGRSSAATASIGDEDIEPVVEMDLASAAEDDEPSMTIEAAEPTDEEAEAEELSNATPLPVAVPLGHEETFMIGAESLAPPPRTGPFTVSIPLGNRVRPLRGTRPLVDRPLHSGALRARPTSEGVVVLCMGPPLPKLSNRQSQNAHSGLRTTQFSVHPTTPSPQSNMVPVGFGSDGHGFDEALIAFLHREASR